MDRASVYGTGGWRFESSWLRHASRALALVAVSMATLLAPDVARACSCMAQEQPEAFQQAASVFEGRVVSQEHPTDPSGEVTVLLDVVRRWKGADAQQVQVITASNSAACGYNFEDGKSYLVYTNAPTDEEGNPTAGLERVSLCSRTAPIENAGADLAAMGEGITPVDPQGGSQAEQDLVETPATQTNGQSAGCASCAVLSPNASEAAPIVGSGLVIALALWRRRRRR